MPLSLFKYASTLPPPPPPDFPRQNFFSRSIIFIQRVFVLQIISRHAHLHWSGNEVDNAISGFPIMLSVSLPKWLLHRASQIKSVFNKIFDFSMTDPVFHHFLGNFIILNFLSIVCYMFGYVWVICCWFICVFKMPRSMFFVLLESATDRHAYGCASASASASWNSFGGPWSTRLDQLRHVRIR